MRTIAKNFAGQDLTGANFRNQNLQRANFRGANLQGADFQGANLRGAKFASNRSPEPATGRSPHFRLQSARSNAAPGESESPRAAVSSSSVSPGSPASPSRPGLTDLRGANFQGAQLQGANFARADLTGANFQGAAGGLQRRMLALQWLTLLGLAIVLLGLGAVLWVAFGRYFFSEETVMAVGVLPGLIILGVQIALCNACFRGNGTDRPSTVAILAALTGFAALVGAGGGDLVAAVVGALAGAGAGLCAAIVAFGLTGLALLRGPIAVFLVLTGAVGLVGMLSLATLGAGVLAIAGAVTGAEGVTVGLLLTLVGLVIFLGLGSWGAWQSQRADRLSGAWRGLLTFAAWGGTRFRHSDVTEVNFARAQVGACNFDRAITTRTQWRMAHGLHQAVPNAALESNWSWLDLLTQGRGRGRDLREANLAGMSLAGANLREANLAGVDLRDSVLTGANLMGADLRGSLCQGTDFTEATLTGAKVGGWSVDGATRWERVDCEYVFWDAAGTDRCPAHPRQMFREGEFERYFGADRSNLMLLLRQGIHPQGLGLALEVLQGQFGVQPGSIVAIEHRDPDVLLRLCLPEENLQRTTPGEIARCFYQAYDRALKPKQSGPSGALVPNAAAPTLPMGTLLGHLLATPGTPTPVMALSLADRLRQIHGLLQNQAATPTIDRGLKYLQILVQWAEFQEDRELSGSDGLQKPDLQDRAELALDALQGLGVILGEEWDEVEAEVRRSLAGGRSMDQSGNPMD